MMVKKFESRENLSEFLISELSKCKIKDLSKLVEYVKFCLDNDIGNKILFESAEHHILPRSDTLIFKEYENFTFNPWNKSILYHRDHCIAHFLLYQALTIITPENWFMGVKVGGDVKSHAEEYHIRKIEECKNQSLKMLDRYENDPAFKDKSCKSAETMKANGIYDRTAERHRKYQQELMPSGLTRAKETGRKLSVTLQKKVADGTYNYRHGSENSIAVKVNIYDSNDILRFECDGNIKHVCDEFNLPFSHFRRSYQQGKIPFKWARGMKPEYFEMYKQFEGWYAIKINKEKPE